MRSVWKSQESERRLRELREGARDRRTTGSSSAAPPLRMIFGTAEPTGTEAGFVSRILGGGGGGAIAAVDVVDDGGGLEELLPPPPAEDDPAAAIGDLAASKNLPGLIFLAVV